MVLFHAMPLRSFAAISALVLSIPASLWAGALPDPGPVETTVAEDAGYAPLALFSLGSLAVGGAFYAINVSSRKPNVARTAGGRSSLANAAGAAGLSALLAAGSYLYFSRDEGDTHPEPAGSVRISGGAVPDGEGGMAVSALVTLPLSSLSR